MFYSFGYTGIILSGLLGAFIVLSLILWLARRINPAYLLLVGVAIAALMGGLLSLVKISGDLTRLQAVLSWLWVLRTLPVQKRHSFSRVGFYTFPIKLYGHQTIRNIEPR